jgi:spore germination protein YaaH
VSPSKSVHRIPLLGITLGLLAAMLLPQGPAGAADRSRAVSGWFGYWTDAQDMIDVAAASGGVLGEVNIFWWHWAGSDRPACTTVTGGQCQGESATPWTNEKFDSARRGLQDLGVLVFATHTDLAATRRRELSEYLATASQRQAMAQRLSDWVVAAGVDGIDLDWENFAFNDGSSTWSTTRPRFTDTVERLAELLHAQGKLLSVTVPGGYRPFNSDGTPNPGGGYTVFDWAALAPHVDRLRLMTYDYSWNRPGPVGPFGWARDAVRSAVAQVGEPNRSKIHIGLHQYGKAWYVRDSADQVVTVGECREGWRPDGSDAIALSPASARSLAQSYGQTPVFDPTHREYTFDYRKQESGYWLTSAGRRRNLDCTVLKRVWFGGSGTAAARAETVAELGIGGVSTWQLGTLDEGFFPALAGLAGKAGDGPQPETPSAPVSYSLDASANKSRPRAGRKVVLRGRLSPKVAGTTVSRQVRVAGKWRTRGSAVTDARGRVRFVVSLPKRPQRFTFRLKAKPTANHGVITSARVAVRSTR